MTDDDTHEDRPPLSRPSTAFERPAGNVHVVPDDGGGLLADVSQRPTIVAPTAIDTRVGTTDLRLGDTIDIVAGEHAGQQARVCGMGGGRKDGTDTTVRLSARDPYDRASTVMVRRIDTRVTSTEEIDRARRVLLLEGWTLIPPPASTAADV